MPRHTRGATLLLLVLLCFCCCCELRRAGAQATNCMYDRLHRLFPPRPRGVAQTPPSKQASPWKALSTTAGEAWIPLRVHVSDLDLTRDGRFCAKDRDGQHIPDFKGGTILCTTYDALTPERRNDLGQLLKVAIKLHTERLLIRSGGGSLNPGAVNQQSVCRHFTVPDEHSGKGIADSDLVLYVSAAPIEKNGQLTAWALACSVGDDGRPVVAAMNFAPNLISVGRFAVRSAAHQIAHALGFDYRRMVGRSMVQQAVKRGKQSILVTTSAVKAAAKGHYGCDTAEGAELENGAEAGAQEKNFYMRSHWERRNAKDELMAPMFGGNVPVAGYYTVLTLAAFHALGFYRANFSMAEHMEWGAGAGCDFLNKKCISDGRNIFPGMFCSDDISVRTQRCTSDRMGMGTCSLLRVLSAPLPDHFRYFGFENKGGCGKMLTDHCPIIVTEKSCYQLLSQSEEKDENVVGMSSWCLNGKKLRVRRNKNEVDIHGVCAEVSCTGNAVKVRLSGDSVFRPCAPNGSITVQEVAGGRFVSGTVNCPLFAEVCTIGPRGESLVSARPVADFDDEPRPARGLQRVQGNGKTNSSGESDGDLGHESGAGNTGVPGNSEKAVSDANEKPGDRDREHGTRARDGSVPSFSSTFALFLLVAFVLDLCAQNAFGDLQMRVFSRHAV